MISGELSSTLFPFAVAYGCMLVVPGPNALIVLQSSRDRSTLKPVLAAAGIALGATLVAALAASSARLLPQGPASQALGSVVIAVVLLRAARQVWSASPGQPASGEQTQPRSGIEPFVLGLGSAVSNPLSVPYFASFFVSHAFTPLNTALACCTVFTMAGAWFASLGLAASRLQQMSLPPLFRRLGNLAFAATLAGLAARYLWVAACR